MLVVELTATFTGVEPRVSLIVGGLLGWLAAAWADIPSRAASRSRAAERRDMRIAIDANVLGGSWGGIPKYLDRIATELIAGGDRVDLLANTRRLNPRFRAPTRSASGVKGTSLWREAFLPLLAVPAPGRRALGAGERAAALHPGAERWSRSTTSPRCESRGEADASTSGGSATAVARSARTGDPGDRRLEATADDRRGPLRGRSRQGQGRPQRGRREVLPRRPRGRSGGGARPLGHRRARSSSTSARWSRARVSMS